MRSSIAAVLAALMLPAPALAASGTTRTYPPKWNQDAGVELALVNGTWAGDGIGVAGRYEMVLSPKAGPGHVSGGFHGLVAFTDDDDRFNCDREESILSATGRVRYTLDVSDVVRPWAGVGIGLYAVNREYDECLGPDDDEDIGVGIPLAFGIDFTLESLTLVLSVTGHETSADEDFSHLGLGVAWRF